MQIDALIINLLLPGLSTSTSTNDINVRVGVSDALSPDERTCTNSPVSPRGAHRRPTRRGHRGAGRIAASRTETEVPMFYEETRTIDVLMYGD